MYLYEALAILEQCVRDIQVELSRLGCDYFIEYSPFRLGVELYDNQNGMMVFEFRTLGETLRYFQGL